MIVVPLAIRFPAATGLRLAQAVGGLNRKLMCDFRLYVLVGGMSQAVDALLRTNDLRAVDLFALCGTIRRGGCDRSMCSVNGRL